MSELSYVPSKRDECGLNILIPAWLLKQSLFFLFAFVPFQQRHVAPFSLEAWSRREFIEKVIEGWYMGHFLIIGQTIGIDLTLAQIIGDFKELSSTLSLSKL